MIGPLTAFSFHLQLNPNSILLQSPLLVHLLLFFVLVLTFQEQNILVFFLFLQHMEPVPTLGWVIKSSSSLRFSRLALVCHSDLSFIVISSVLSSSSPRSSPIPKASLMHDSPYYLVVFSLHLGTK